MISSNAVAVVMCESNKFIDKLELETGIFGAEDKKFLAAFQTKLSSGRTSQSQDLYFLSLVQKWFRYVSMRK